MEHPTLSVLLQIAMCVIFYVVGTTYSDDSVNLLVGCKEYALLFNSTNHENVKQFGPKDSTASRVDYHYSKNLLFAHVDGKLFRSPLFETGTPQQPSLVLEVGSCPGFAVDWIHDLIYWAKCTKYESSISVMDLEGKNSKAVTEWTYAYSIPHIKIDPCSGLLFWLRNDAIEFSDTSGQYIRQISVTPYKRVKAMALDIHNQRLFYIENSLDETNPKVFSINYSSNDINKKKTYPAHHIFKFVGFLFHKGFFYGVEKELFKDHIYKASLDNIDKHYYTFRDKGIKDLKVLDPELQPKAGSCPIKSTDDKSYSEHSVKLLIGSNEYVQMYNSTDMRNPHQLYVSRIEKPYNKVRLDYHYGKNLLFTHTNGKLYRSPLFEPEMPNHEPSLVVEMGRCPGFAVDWIHDVIYWANCSHNTSISVIDLDGNNPTRILDLTTEYFKPINQIAVDPCSELLFWIRDDVIESSDTKGQHFRTKIAANEIVSVITLDAQNQQLFYVETRDSQHTLYSINYSSNKITTYFRTSAVAGEYGLAVYKGFVYWVEYTVDDDIYTLYEGSLNGFGFEYMTKFHKNRIRDLKVVAADLQLSSNQCSNKKTSITAGTVAN